jgi:hypothetical protein
VVTGLLPYEKEFLRRWTAILINFNPHVHVLAADGAFLPDGRLVTLPVVPGSLLG